MALDPLITASLLAVLGQRWQQTSCLLCGVDDWEIHGYVTLHIGSLDEDPFSNTGKLPCAAVICRHCGNTILVNTRILAAGRPR